VLILLVLLFLLDVVRLRPVPWLHLACPLLWSFSVFSFAPWGLLPAWGMVVRCLLCSPPFCTFLSSTKASEYTPYLALNRVSPYSNSYKLILLASDFSTILAHSLLSPTSLGVHPARLAISESTSCTFSIAFFASGWLTITSLYAALRSYSSIFRSPGLLFQACLSFPSNSQ